eukprot:788355-Rhodomonas_salina.1
MSHVQTWHCTCRTWSATPNLASSPELVLGPSRIGCDRHQQKHSTANLTGGQFCEQFGTPETIAIKHPGSNAPKCSGRAPSPDASGYWHAATLKHAANVGFG